MRREKSGPVEAGRSKAAPKNSSAAADPKGERGSDGQKLAALNQSGAFLHIAAIQAAKSSHCSVLTELPVGVAPFVSDPMAQAGAASRRIDSNGPLFRNRTRMQAAIANSQDYTQGRQRTVDVVATKNIGRKSYAFTMEVKRLDPHYVDWVFIDQNMESRGYFATAVSTWEAKGALSLMKIPRHSMDGLDLHVQKERLAKIDSIVSTRADYGLVITHTSNKKPKGQIYKFQDTSLHDAARQVLEGAYGMIVDMVTHQAVNATLQEHVALYCIPIIVTNANLRICRYTTEDLTDDLAGMKEVELETCSSLVYHSPHPVVTRFPHQITGIDRSALTPMATKWPVIVTNIGDLKRILNGL